MDKGRDSDRDRIRWLHDVLIDRGWRLDSLEVTRLDERGYPTGRQPSWWYPASFGTVLPQPVLEIAPEPLHCSYLLGAVDEITELLLVSAGSDLACPSHAKTELTLSLDTLPDILPSYLDHAERQARETDVRELIECRFFGPCGAAWDEYGNPRRH